MVARSDVVLKSKVCNTCAAESHSVPPSLAKNGFHFKHGKMLPHTALGTAAEGRKELCLRLQRFQLGSFVACFGSL